MIKALQQNQEDNGNITNHHIVSNANRAELKDSAREPAAQLINSKDSYQDKKRLFSHIANGKEKKYPTHGSDIRLPDRG